MINENRLNHILGVARKAYKIAKSLDFDENFSRKMFALGWNHDIGYEFDPNYHESVGADILAGWEYSEYIRTHGIVPQNIDIEWIIINLADMTTSPTGKEISLDDRLKEIESRYGTNNIWYQQSKSVCDVLKNYLETKKGEKIWKLIQ